MVEWYRTSRWQDSLIVAVTIERFTESSVWLKGRRHARSGQYENFFPTWEEARDYLLDRAESDLSVARNALQRAQGLVGNIKGLRPPVTSSENAS